jgi:DinB superfamily
MAETTQQYVERILHTLGSRDPVDVLQETPQLLAQVMAKFSSEQISKRPAPDKWSPKEIAVHISEVEMMVAVRVRLVLGANGIGITGFDQNAWAARYQQADLDTAMAAFHALRAANLALFRSLTPEQWEHYGMHSERGKETARRIVELCAGHDINHLRQLEAMASQPVSS